MEVYVRLFLGTAMLAFLGGCATSTPTGGAFNLEPYKAMSCEQLKEMRVQLDIERQKIDAPSAGAMLIPIAGWAYYGVKNSIAKDKLVEISTKRTAIRSQQARCTKLDLFD